MGVLKRHKKISLWTIFGFIIVFILFDYIIQATVKDNVWKLINNRGLSIDGIVSMETLCSSYEKEAMDNAGENYLFPLILLISAWR